MHDKKLSPRARQALNESKMAIEPQAAPGVSQPAVHIPPGKPTPLRLQSMAGHDSTFPLLMRSRHGSRWGVTPPLSQASPTCRSANAHWPKIAWAFASIGEQYRPSGQVQL